MRTIISISVILFLGLYSVPYIVRDQVVVWLHKQGVEQATFKAVHVNWWTGEVTLDSLVAQTPNRTPLQLERLQISLDYPALFEQRVWISALTVQGLNGALQEDEQGLWLGPINLSTLLPETESTPSTSDTRWMYGISEIAIANVDWAFRLPQLDQTLRLEQASLNHLVQWNPSENTEVSIQGALNGSPFVLNSAATPLPQSKKASIHLDLDRVAVESLARFWAPELRAQLSTKLDITLSFDGEKGTLSHQGDIQIDQFNWQGDALNLNAPELTWTGNGALIFSSNSLESVALEGALSSQAFALKQKEMAVNFARLDWQGGVDLLFKAAQLTSLKGPQSIAVKQLSVKSADQQVTLASAKQKGALQIQFNKGSASVIQTQLNAQFADLAVAMPELNLELSSATVNSPLKLGLAEQMQIAAKPSMAIQGLSVEPSNGLRAQVDQAELTAEIAQATAAAPAIDSFDLTLKRVSVEQADKGLNVISLNSLSINNGRFANEQLHLANTALQGIRFNTPAGKRSMSTMDSVSIKALEFLLASQKLTLQRVNVKDSRTQLTVTDRLQVAELERLNSLFAQATNPVSPATAKAKAQDESGPHIVIGKLSLVGDNQIAFADYSVKPTFKSDISISKLNVASIDSKRHTLSPFELEALINKHAQLSASGKLSLTNGVRDGEWIVDLNNAELPVVSPYSGRYVGYYLQSGQLNIKSRGQVQKGVLSGENHITLNRLEVKAAQTEATDAFNQKLSMPLGTAISVLQDDKDNITLDLPVEGSLDDPKFGYQDIINRLATKGLKKAAMSFLTKALQPYGALISIASAAISANESGAFIQLAPVSFLPGQSQSKMLDYLAKIAEMMKERQGLRLNVCGNAVQADKEQVWPLLVKENAASKKPLSPEMLETVLNDRMQQLAVTRGEFVTRWLLEQGLEKDRLFTCFPVLDLENPELQPNVVLSL